MNDLSYEMEARATVSVSAVCAAHITIEKNWEIFHHSVEL